MAKNSPAAVDLAGIVRRLRSDVDRLAAQVPRQEASRSRYEHTARGVIARQSLTAPSSVYSADATTDFALAGVPVLDTRLYKVCVRTQYEVVNATGAFALNFHVGGTLTDRLGIIETEAGRWDFNGALLWLPSPGTVNVDLRLDEFLDGSTLQFEASATNTRQFWIEDVGAR